MKKLVAVALLLILLISHTDLAADDLEQLVVSNDKTKWRQGTQAAMAPNGDVMVVWTEEENSTFTSYRIVATMCKFGPDGRYTVETPEEITHDLKIPARSTVAYNQIRNTWVVVWNQRVKPLFPGAGLELYSAELSTDGTINGGHKEVLSSSGDKIVHPYLHWIRRGSQAGGYLLLWTVRKPEIGDTTGVWSMVLNADLTPAGASHRLFSVSYDPFYDGPGFAVYPGLTTDVEQKTNGDFIVGVAMNWIPKPLVGATFTGNLLRLDPSGKLISSTEFARNDAPFPVRLVRLKKQLFVATFWSGNSEIVAFFYQLFRGNLKPRNTSPQQFVATPWVMYGDITKLNDDKGAYSVYINEKKIWGQYVNKNGKISLGDQKRIRGAAGKAVGEFRAFCLPGTNRIFLLWQRRLTSGGNEIRGLIFDAL